MISLLIASPARLHRENLANVFVGTGDCRVDGVAGTWPEVMTLAGQTQPAVALLDTNIIPDPVGVREIFKVAPSTKVITAAMLGLSKDHVRWLEAGVSGCVTCDASVDDVKRTVRAVVAGYIQFPAEIVEYWLQGPLLTLHDVGTAPSWCGRENTLTSRESEVASLIGKGLSNKAIAHHLRIARGTVKNHVHNTLQKLGLERRSQIAVWFVRARDRSL